MRPDPQRVRDLFIAALDLEPEALPTYLDEVCGDDAELRSAVDSLLGLRDEGTTTRGSGSAFQDTLIAGEDEEAVPVRAPGRYRELSELGIGGCGRVTRVWDDGLKRVVAHKQVRFGDPRWREMLRHEARLLAWLDHPGAVPVYDGAFDAERPYYTMRLLDGETLRGRLRSQGTLPIREAIRVLARVSETMANAHAKGVLHLDLKPANIMLLRYGQVCILDWGVARFHDPEAYQAYLGSVGDSEVVQRAGYAGIAGTPAYMPVEQALGDEMTPATDIYACGVILYEMLTGRIPYTSGETPMSVFEKATAQATPPRELRADVPEALEALCLRMIASEPEDRPASFEQVIEALDRLNHGVTRTDVRHLAGGEVLFREGEPGSEAYQILDGALCISVDGPDGPTELALRGVGDLVGEMAVVSGAPRSATVTAVGPTRVAVVTAAVIEGALETANPLLARMLRSLVDRLREEAERARRA